MRENEIDKESGLFHCGPSILVMNFSLVITVIVSTVVDLNFFSPTVAVILIIARVVVLKEITIVHRLGHDVEQLVKTLLIQFGTELLENIVGHLAQETLRFCQLGYEKVVEDGKSFLARIVTLVLFLSLFLRFFFFLRQ